MPKQVRRQPSLRLSYCKRQPLRSPRSHSCPMSRTFPTLKRKRPQVSGLPSPNQEQFQIKRVLHLSSTWPSCSNPCSVNKTEPVPFLRSSQTIAGVATLHTLNSNNEGEPNSGEPYFPWNRNQLKSAAPSTPSSAVEKLKRAKRFAVQGNPSSILSTFPTGEKFTPSRL